MFTGTLIIILLVLSSNPLLATCQTPYFPEGVFSGISRINDSMAGEYSKYLCASKESPLYRAVLPNGSQAYRLLWIPPYGSVRIFRLEQEGENRMLRYVVLSGPGGEKEVPILYDKTFILKDSEWSGFVAIIDGLNFWTASTPQRRHGLDGDIWVLEGLCADRYHVIERSFLDVQSGDDVYLYRLFRFLLRRVVWEDGGARETKGTSLKSETKGTSLKS